MTLIGFRSKAIYLMISILQLSVINPACDGAKDGLGHQGQAVFYQRPHIRVTVLDVRVDG